MTRGDIDRTKLGGGELTSVQWATLTLVVFAHLLTVEALILQPMWLVPTSNIPRLLAVPIAQNGLLMLWSMAGSGRSYVRFPIAIMAAIGTWYVTICFLGTVNTSVGAAFWIAGFAAESTVIIVGMFGLYRCITRGSNRNQFGMFTLMAWTAIIAIVLALLRLSHQRWGWTIGLASSEYFWVLPYYFAGCGLIAIAVVTSITLSAPLSRRVCIALIVAFAVGYGIPATSPLIWKTQGLIRSTEYRWIIFWELCILYATVLPLRFLFVRPIELH